MIKRDANYYTLRIHSLKEKDPVGNAKLIRKLERQKRMAEKTN